MFQDVINKVRLDNKLDVNLEKSQVKEMVRPTLPKPGEETSVKL